MTRQSVLAIMVVAASQWRAASSREAASAGQRQRGILPPRVASRADQTWRAARMSRSEARHLRIVFGAYLAKVAALFLKMEAFS